MGLARRVELTALFLAGVVVASLVGAPLPAAADEEPRPAHQVFSGRTLPAARALAAGADQVDASNRYYFVQAIHDLDGDGIGDVIVQVYDITSAPVDVRFTASTGSLTVTALSGSTGRELGRARRTTPTVLQVSCRSASARTPSTECSSSRSRGAPPRTRSS